MNDTAKPSPKSPASAETPPHRVIGDDPFADMQPVDWLELTETEDAGTEAAPLTPPPAPPLIKIQDEADAALALWLNQDEAPTPPSAPDANIDLLDWLLATAEKEKPPEMGS